MSRASNGFTLVEILASVSIFVIVFLSSTACIAHLLLDQNLSYQRTVAGTAAMILTNWHVERSIAESSPKLGFIANTTTGPGQILTEKFSTQAVPWSNIVFNTGDFIGTPGPSADRVFSFSGTTVTDGVNGASIDLSEYQNLVVTVSPPSGREADSKMSFCQVSLWYLPANNLADAISNAYTPADPTHAQFLGRYLVPDTYIP
jgi:prepilin-type N-terminal cleavage/methylation domain-containing protein